MLWQCVAILGFFLVHVLCVFIAVVWVHGTLSFGDFKGGEIIPHKIVPGRVPPPPPSPILRCSDYSSCGLGCGVSDNLGHAWRCLFWGYGDGSGSFGGQGYGRDNAGCGFLSPNPLRSYQRTPVTFLVVNRIALQSMNAIALAAPSYWHHCSYGLPIRTAPRDHQPPTANRRQPPTANP